MLIYDVLWCFNILLSDFMLYFFSRICWIFRINIFEGLVWIQLENTLIQLENMWMQLENMFGFSKKIRGLDLVRKYVVWIQLEKKYVDLVRKYVKGVKYKR